MAALKYVRPNQLVLGHAQIAQGVRLAVLVSLIVWTRRFRIRAQQKAAANEAG